MLRFPLEGRVSPNATGACFSRQSQDQPGSCYATGRRGGRLAVHGQTCAGYAGGSGLSFGRNAEARPVVLFWAISAVCEVARPTADTRRRLREPMGNCGVALGPTATGGRPVGHGRTTTGRRQTHTAVGATCSRGRYAPNARDDTAPTTRRSTNPDWSPKQAHVRQRVRKVRRVSSANSCVGLRVEVGPRCREPGISPR